MIRPRWTLVVWQLLFLAPLAAAGEEGEETDQAGAERMPVSWSIASGLNLRWSVELGSESYGGPVVAGERVFVGTNNEHPRDPQTKGDRGVLMAFSAADGRFLWQATHDKLATGSANDWPLQGVCSTPTVVGERLYYVSNRGELVCREASTGALVWSLDMPRTLGVHPTHMSASSPVVIDELVFALTGNGPDERGGIPAPEAPSFVAVDRRDGRVRWADGSPGGGLIEGQWSSPTYGTVAGQPLILFPAGNGWLYAFAPATGEPLWRFDGNSRLAPEDAARRRRRNAFVARALLVDGRAYLGVGRDPEAGSGPGFLWAIDASLRGDITAEGAVWVFDHEDLGRTISTVATFDGLLVAADLNGFVHGLDAKSGERLWVYDALSPIWGSPLVADGKVYIGDDDGEVTVLRAAPRLEVLAEVPMGSAIRSSPAAAGGVLYIMTRERLFAIAHPVRSHPGASPPS